MCQRGHTTMTDYQHRKVMWVFLSRLFEHDVDELDFMWIFSQEDAVEANQFPDGTHGGHHCAGVVRGAI